MTQTHEITIKTISWGMLCDEHANGHSGWYVEDAKGELIKDDALMAILNVQMLDARNVLIADGHRHYDRTTGTYSHRNSCRRYPSKRSMTIKLNSHGRPTLSKAQAAKISRLFNELDKEGYFAAYAQKEGR